MSTPGEESRADLAWREIVENYGERAVLDEDPPPGAPSYGADAQFVAAHPGGQPEDLEDDLDGAPDGAPNEDIDDLFAVSERFTPPPPPPFPRPRSWQRGAAWAGLFVAPLLGLMIALSSIYLNPLIGWCLIGWFVGGFVYLVREMPTSRDPWDDGSRV